MKVIIVSRAEDNIKNIVSYLRLKALSFLVIITVLRFKRTLKEDLTYKPLSPAVSAPIHLLFTI